MTNNIPPTSNTASPFTPLLGSFDQVARDMASMQASMDQVFQTFMNTTAQTMNTAFQQFHNSLATPADMMETDKAIQVVMAAPGYNQDNIQVEYSPKNRELTIRGRHNDRTQAKDDNQAWAQQQAGQFFVRLPIVADVDAKKLKTNLENGLLTITLPKS